MIEVPDVVTDLNLPHLRAFAEMLRFAPLEGRIWMGDRRMVLLHAEAFAALRNELIASLGSDTARGLLTRIGYAAGCRDAELAWKHRPQDATFDQLLGSGSALHGLQGFVRVERLRTRQANSVGTDDLRLEWIWRDSMEDEGHVGAHGVGSESACWTAVGYSSGYLSTCAGRRILVRETQCRAMGAAHCRAEARPVAAWGEEAEEDLRHLEPQARPPRQHPGGWQGTTGGVASTDAPGPQAADRQAPASGARGAGAAASDPASAIVGASAAFHVLRHHVLRVAPTRATVLLLGESGVGKSALAREIHRHSERAARPFVEVNCAAIPEQLIESELFGVERGAYSGATQSRAGRFEIADGGTLFLDEIATLSHTAQGKLLRVLQTGELERLGNTRTVVTDVRVIAATNEDLAAEVDKRRFREDLFFRLNVFPLLVPPLRERRDDIPLLTEGILERFGRRHGCRVSGITPRAMQMLLRHPWPGNIRELENMLERGVILAGDGAVLDVHHLVTLGGAAGPGLNARAALVSLPPAAQAPAPAAAPAGGSPEADATAVPAAPPPGAAGGVLPDRGAEAGAALPREPALDEIAEQLLAHGGHSLDAVEDSLVRAALARSGGNVSRAALLLGLTRAQMAYRARKLVPG